ncbi:pro-Pol polyprotein [Nephila pilipes]|uniref:Pro-Pol polyprotein n=1 Tax=Nephila pilipes TaxID=299642 RepID=A0A8X6MP77_NEPPI|nr:pro-Pol polyprotein [Nephila pilipes]
MQRRAENQNVADSLQLELFLQQLPSHVQSILASISPLTAQKAADKILDISPIQKPLIFAFKQKPEKCSPRQLSHLDHISQFSTDIRHVNGKDNIIADAFSRIEIDAIPTPSKLDYKMIAQ